MRARSISRPSLFAGLGLVLATACIPDPGGDFTGYQDDMKRINAGSSGASGGLLDAAPPTSASGLFGGQCLSQLAFGLTSRTFSFVVETKFTPTSEGSTSGKFTLTLTALRLESGAPPKTFTAGAKTGVTQGNPEPATPNVDSGKFTVDLGVVTVPGDANPITGRDVRIENTKLLGRLLSEQSFCARLAGTVTQPVTVELEPPQNICQFRVVTEGGPMPEFTAADFKPEACPE